MSPADQAGQPNASRPGKQGEVRQCSPYCPCPAASAPAEPVLLVAACGGPRCRALRALHDPSARAPDPCGQLLREAVRQRPGAVLISTGCLGPCERACVAAVGWGMIRGGLLRWSGRPAGLGLVEMPARAAALAAWISGSAPDLKTLPEDLWRIGVT